MAVLREDYFDVALDLLADAGATSLTIANLCERLGVTKGSFYHHFESGPVFHRALIEHWEVAYSRDLVALAMSVDDARERIRLLEVLGVGLRHEAESAIRAWARSEQFVAEMQRRVDEERMEVVTATIVEAGLDPVRAVTFGRIAVAILIGSQQFEHPVDRESLRASYDEFVEWVLALTEDPTAPA